ncbi:MAG: oligosaccharide flippase family protein [Proteobacteria bacterium]|nr:oligosaccharide flippase family protein [Pseudomonadota bacterium]MBI3497937.1 oligosaccharide flippase family protein [Pseudomonadota bacterium]
MPPSSWSISEPPPAASVRANLLALGTSEVFARVAQLLSLAILARVLGQEGMGVVGTAWAIYQLAVPFVQYAPELIGTREVARGVEARAAFVSLTLVKLLIAVFACLPIAVCAAFFLDADPAAQLQVALQCPVLFAVALSGVWVFRGQRRLWAYAAVRIVSSAALLAGLFFGLGLVPLPWVVPVAETLTGLIGAAIAYALLMGAEPLQRVVAEVRASLPELRTHVAEAVQFGLGAFLAAAMWSAPMLVARVFLDPGEQGVLAATIRLILAVSSLFQLALQVFHPVLAYRYTHDRESAKSLAAALVVQVFAVTIPVALAVALLSPWIAGSLLGSEFDRAAIVLTALAPTLIPTAVSSVFGYALLADGRYQLYVFICAGGAAASVLGCWIAFSLLPDPEAAAVLAPVMTLVALVQAFIVWRLDLVSYAHVSWRQLAPSRIWQMLKER